MRGLWVLMTFACATDVIQHDGDAPGVDTDGGADVDTGTCGDAGLHADAATSGCPTLPPLCPEDVDRERPNVEIYEGIFEMEMRDEPWASAKESEIYTRYPTATDNFGTAGVDRVECRTSVCVVMFLYQIDEPGDLWFESRLRGEILENIAETCGFAFFGRYTFAERSCGMFEQRVFVRCDR
jgi:hypothetical protein